MHCLDSFPFVCLFAHSFCAFSKFIRRLLCTVNTQTCRYKWLDKAFPGTTKQIIVKKLLLDQFLMTPNLLVIFYTGEM